MIVESSGPDGEVKRNSSWKNIRRLRSALNSHKCVIDEKSENGKVIFRRKGRTTRYACFVTLKPASHIFTMHACPFGRTFSTREKRNEGVHILSTIYFVHSHIREGCVLQFNHSLAEACRFAWCSAPFIAYGTFQQFTHAVRRIEWLPSIKTCRIQISSWPFSALSFFSIPRVYSLRLLNV